jgi:hypothetical protein
VSNIDTKEYPWYKRVARSAMEVTATAIGSTKRRAGKYYQILYTINVCDDFEASMAALKKVVLTTVCFDLMVGQERVFFKRNHSFHDVLFVDRS